MKWFNQWFAKKCQQAWEEAQLQPSERDSSEIKRASIGKYNRIGLLTEESVQTNRALNITVSGAIGGRIVSFRRYDEKTDNHTYNTYVIPDQLDFEKELGKIITLESMRL